MIKIEDIKKLNDIDILEKVYDELMLHGVDCIPITSRQERIKYFSKVCHDLIMQYLIWNDYIHSNNVMQLCKSLLFRDTAIKKPTWFLRYEIIIYGRRTPLYFIENPQALFDKIDAICNAKQVSQEEKLVAAVEMLFSFYFDTFLSPAADGRDREIFIRRFKNCFLPVCQKYLHSGAVIPERIRLTFTKYIEYIEHPEQYIEPGIKTGDLWEEDDDGDAGISKPGTLIFENITQKAEPILADDSEDEMACLRCLEGKTVRIIGAFNNNGVKGKLNCWQKRYHFTIDDFGDYDKIKNKDLTSMQYSLSISGILAGAMPHSIKGKGDYSSGLAMLQNEPGYPPVVVATVNREHLDKVSVTSLKRAMKELCNIIMAKG